MGLIFVVSCVVLLSCSPGSHEIEIGITNNNTVPLSLVISNNAQVPGPAIGSAIPAVVEPHEAITVRLVVPSSMDWALFVVPGDPFPPNRPALTAHETQGCRGRVPIELTFGHDEWVAQRSG